MKTCILFHTLLATTVLFFGVPTLHSAETSPPADLIIHNAKVITVNSTFGIGQAIAVRGEDIAGVGKDKEIEHLRGPNTRMIDAHGATILPGLIDSDVDSYLAATAELNDPTPPFQSLAEALDYLRTQAAQKPTNAWITIDHVYPTRIKEGRLPNLAELDAAAPKNPVYWNCGPLVMLNSQAMLLSHITISTTNPPGGEVVINPDTLKPTGLLHNAAALVKLPVAHSPAPEKIRASLKQLYQLYNQQGITSISESHAEPPAIDLFRDLAQANELTVRIRCNRTIDPAGTVEESLARLRAVTNTPAGKMPYGPTGFGDNWVRIGALKCKLDGDIRTGTAYLRAPWGVGKTYGIVEPSYRGDFVEDPEVLPALFLKAAQGNWQLGVDCAGDACLDQVLNCFQNVQFKTDITHRRFLINHGTFQADQDWDRCHDLGLVASLQPAWLYRDGDSLEKTLGDHRLKKFIAAKTWLAHGITIGAGSSHVAGTNALDATNPFNPWLGLWTLLTRQTSSGAQIDADEKIDRQQAIACYTINNAYLAFDENKKGSLELGKLADLIMVDKDLLKCPVDDIRNAKVQLTMVNGKIVWEK